MEEDVGGRSDTLVATVVSCLEIAISLQSVCAQADNTGGLRRSARGEPA